MRKLAWLCGLWATSMAVGGCNLDNEGQDFPSGTIYFPTAMAATTEAGRQGSLLVASSNFDLRYNSGALHSFDLDAVEAAVASQRGLCAGGCEPLVIDPATVLVDEARIDSQATGLSVSPDQDRVYVATRAGSTPRLAFANLSAGAIDCGQGSGGRCGDEFSVTGVAAENDRRASLPPDPVGVLSGRTTDLPFNAGGLDTTFIAMTHRSGAVSLFFDDGARAPEFVHAAGGFEDSVSTGRLDPATGAIWLPSSAPEASVMGRAGLAIDPSPTRSFIFDAGEVSITGVDDGSDIRDVAFDPRPEVNRTYLVSRAPAALLIADSAPSNGGRLRVQDAVGVGFGASRVSVATVASTTLAFVSCFNSRDVFVVDVDAGRLLAVARGFSGPFEMSIDEGRELMYVADFRSSTVRVVDLQPLTNCLRGQLQGDACEPQLIANIGEPNPVGELL